jgi:hypothetical protein
VTPGGHPRGTRAGRAPALVLLLLAACGSAGKEPGLPTAVVLGITGPLATDVATAFTLSGRGFASILGETVDVVFEAETGTPFAGDAATATVEGTVVADETVTGTAPTAVASAPFLAYVTVRLRSGLALRSAGPIARFEPPPATKLGAGLTTPAR